MGDAKNRGTKEERKAAAIIRRKEAAAKAEKERVEREIERARHPTKSINTLAAMTAVMLADPENLL